MITAIRHYRYGKTYDKCNLWYYYNTFSYAKSQPAGEALLARELRSVLPWAVCKIKPDGCSSDVSS